MVVHSATCERIVVALLIGVFLALAVGVFATSVGLDRDRAFYPTVTIVIALLYALFAVMGESADALVRESLAGYAWRSRTGCPVRDLPSPIPPAPRAEWISYGADARPGGRCHEAWAD